MVALRTARVRLLSTQSIPGGVTREPILLISACPATDCADESVRYCVDFDPDGLFSRDNAYVSIESLRGFRVYSCTQHEHVESSHSSDRCCAGALGVRRKHGCHRIGGCRERRTQSFTSPG